MKITDLLCHWLEENYYHYRVIDMTLATVLIYDYIEVFNYDPATSVPGLGVNSVMISIDKRNGDLLLIEGANSLGLKTCPVGNVADFDILIKLGSLLDHFGIERLYESTESS